MDSRRFPADILRKSDEDSCCVNITKTRLFKYIENFTAKKGQFSDKKKKSDIFHIYAQNIDNEYSLEPPRRGGSNVYYNMCFLVKKKKNNIYPCKSSFTV